MRKFDGQQQQVTLRRPVRALPSPVTTRLDGSGSERVGTIRLSNFNARAQVSALRATNNGRLRAGRSLLRAWV